MATYAHPGDADFDLRAAAESGYEGVACLDDAARAALLYTAIWQRDRSPWAREAAEGLLRFTCAMQLEDGAFANFIATWDGERQLDTPTSRPGEGPWQARAMHALARGVAAFGDHSYAAAFTAGLPFLAQPMPHLDTRAASAIAVLEYWQATAEPGARALALEWAHEIADARVGDVLPDIAGSTEVHLWGHLQESALARIGEAFGIEELISVAARSVASILIPAVERAFAGPGSLAFDVSCTVAGLDATAAATKDARYTHHAAAARAWFDGRNAAGRAVYDRERGFVADGIDGDRVSKNSGAESNIEGALALLDVLPWGEIQALVAAAESDRLTE
ncbi:MAG: hypothetical protein WEA81_03645 [Dehalococcoidia bacterium]